MKYLDEACAWLIFLAGVVHMVLTEVFPGRGGVLDTGLLVIFLAMFNLLRIRNGYTVKLLKVFCIGANVATLMFEIVRWNMFDRPTSLGFATIWSLSFLALVLIETVLSITTNPPLAQTISATKS
jgi:hypothetical protein